MAETPVALPNSAPGKPIVLCVDDEEAYLLILESAMREEGHEVMKARNGQEVFELVQSTKPDVILLDVMMHGMSGHEICIRLQSHRELSEVPIIFMSGADPTWHKGLALSLGAVAFLSKPLDVDELKTEVRRQLQTKKSWNQLRQPPAAATDGDATAAKSEPAVAPKVEAPPAAPPAPKIEPPAPTPSESPRPLDFPAFKDFLLARLKLDQEQKERFDNITPGRLYEMTASLGIASSQISKYAALFMGWDYVTTINPESVQLGVFPASFCRANQIICVRHGERDSVILTNPFNQELMSLLAGRYTRFMTTDPNNIVMMVGKEQPEASPSVPMGESLTAPEIADQLLENAVYRGASDIHIEPKGGTVVIRFRVDGEMTNVFTVKEDTGLKIVSRFKTLAGLDVAEHRRPQDGAMELRIQDRPYVMRLATSSTSYGESLVMRLLEPNAEAKRLDELGMSATQVKQMLEFSEHKQGLLLIVGATGNGKTTTVYSLLNQMMASNRSLITVEDPVEYRIKGANQQQVNVKGGVTFEALLKSSVRQDPDILFIGEMRDPQSTKIAVDFASTGHLTISTLHTSNATTAIFRLERLEMKRATLADAVLGIVAQKLLKKLCTHCRKIGPLAPEDATKLRPFVKELPTQAAYPVGCVKCGDTGYAGREGVYEILQFYPEVVAMVRDNKPIPEIRKFIHDKGDDLMSDQAIDKVRRFVFSPKDIFNSVLAEEERPKEIPREISTAPIPASIPTAAPASIPAATPASIPAAIPAAAPATTPAILPDVIGAPAAAPASASAPIAAPGSGASVLVVEDSSVIQSMVQLALQGAGYRVTLAGDGAEALASLADARFDLIISDINMPRMDGITLMENLRSKKNLTPVIFLTAHNKEENEARCLDMGAADFIAKPVKAELLLVRVMKTLRR